MPSFSDLRHKKSTSPTDSSTVHLTRTTDLSYLSILFALAPSAYPLPLLVLALVISCNLPPARTATARPPAAQYESHIGVDRRGG